jgi:hypothetical protein
MAVTPEMLQWVERVLPEQRVRRRMLVLGNHHIWTCDGEPTQLDGVDRLVPWVRRQGFSCQRTRYQLDSLRVSALGQFDVVLHIAIALGLNDQAGLFRALHDLCRSGGRMLHCLPHKDKDSTLSHVYDIQFARALAHMNDYGILDYHHVEGLCGMPAVCAALVKRHDNPFAGIPVDLVTALPTEDPDEQQD